MDGSRRSRGYGRNDSRDKSPISHIERQSQLDLDVTKMTLEDTRGKGSERKSTQDTEYRRARRKLEKQLKKDSQAYPRNKVALETAHRLAVNRLKEEYNQPIDLQAEQEAREERISTQLARREEKKFKPTLEPTEEDLDSKYAKRMQKRKEKKFQSDFSTLDQE